MQRPGYLGEYKGIVPKNSGLGFIPPPPPPKKLDTAINKKTKKHYMQDSRCKTGEFMKTTTIKCFTDKFKFPFHPDPRCGCSAADPCTEWWETHTESECEDDPNYQELPDKKWHDCSTTKAAYKKLGIPEQFALEYCKRRKLPETAPKPKKVAKAAPSLKPKAAPARMPPVIIRRPPSLLPSFDQILKAFSDLVGGKKVRL